jgi:hypothetical protein
VADQLATPSDLASLLQSDLDASTANLLAEIATAVVQAECQQRIVEVTETVTFDLDGYDGGVYLVLPERPLTAVTSAVIGATTVTDYTAQLSRSRLWRARGWRSTLIAYYNQPSTVTVTYTHGYPAGHQRLQLARAAVLSLARYGYSNPDGATSVKIDDYAATYDVMAARMEAMGSFSQRLKRQYGRPPNSVRLVCTEQQPSTFAYGQYA